jgi:hypothetical protein
MVRITEFLLYPIPRYHNPRRRAFGLGSLDLIQVDRLAFRAAGLGVDALGTLGRGLERNLVV